MADPKSGVTGTCTYKFVAGTGWVKQSQSNGLADCPTSSGPYPAAANGTVVVMECSTGKITHINP